MGSVRPARRFDALRASSSRGGRGDCSSRRPSLRFRLPTEVCRSTPAPSRDSEESTRPTMLPSLGFPAPRHIPERGTRSIREASRPHGVPRSRFGHLLRGVHPRPCGRPCGLPSVHGLLASRRSPRVGRSPSRGTLPSCRLARRFASLLKVRADTFGFRASIPTSSSFRPPSPCGRGASMPPCGSSLQSVLPHRPCERFDSRPLPHHALGGMTSRPACVSRSCGAVRSACPSRGRRLSWVSSPCDRHGATRTARRAGVWIRLPMRGCNGPRHRSLPSQHDPTGTRRPQPSAAVLR